MNIRFRNITQIFAQLPRLASDPGIHRTASVDAHFSCIRHVGCEKKHVQ